MLKPFLFNVLSERFYEKSYSIDVSATLVVTTEVLKPIA